MATTANQEIWQMLDSRSFGGIETHVLHLAGALKRRGEPVRVVMLADHGDHPLCRRLKEEGIAVEHLQGGPLGVFKAFLRRPRLVHTHGYKAGILARAAGWLTGVAVVSTFHAGEPGRGRLRIYDYLDRMTAFLAPALAVSHTIAGRLNGPVTVIDNFVPVPAHSIQPKPDTVAFVGRLSPEKGPDIFCELAGHFPELRFEVFGDGPMRDGLEKAHGDRVTFHGAVDDMERRWDQCGLLCMPSRYEGLPMAALEAMAHGVPVVAFAVGALPNLIEDGRNGWLAPPLNTIILEYHLQNWSRLSRDERHRFATRARDTIQAAYSPEAVLPKILDVYGLGAPA